MFLLTVLLKGILCGLFPLLPPRRKILGVVFIFLPFFAMHQFSAPELIVIGCERTLRSLLSLISMVHGHLIAITAWFC